MTLEEAQALPIEQWQTELLECLRRISEARYKCREPRTKPMLGGPFGAGGFSICSYHFVDSLDGVVYFVRSDASGFVIGSSEQMVEAVQHARSVLTNVSSFKLQAYMNAFVTWKEEFDTEQKRLRDAAWEARRAQVVSNLPTNIKSIPRRRRQIFEESAGKCHYCSTALTLDGKWHIEHKHPRALGGGNEPNNLVASCVPCNMKKRDSTDIEFKARISKEKAA